MLTILKKHAVRRITILVPAIFYISSLVCSYSEQQIESFASTQFSTLPGFNITKSSKNIGHFFEMEAALYISRYFSEESILGFSLEINLLDGTTFYDQDDKKITLTTAEFDIITSNFIIECKLGGWPDHRCKVDPSGSRSLTQFIKEKHFLLWIEWVNKKINRGQVKIEYVSCRKNRPIFKLTFRKKRCAKTEETLLSCNWITAGPEQECVGQLLEIFRLLNGKTLLVVFKSKICPTCKICLDENSINYRGGIVF